MAFASASPFGESRSVPLADFNQLAPILIVGRMTGVTDSLNSSLSSYE